MTDPHNEEEPVRCTCGRLLTDDLSKRRGKGPHCWRKLHGRAAPKGRRPAPATEAGPGQDELPLEDQLTIWDTP